MKNVAWNFYADPLVECCRTLHIPAISECQQLQIKRCNSAAFCGVRELAMQKFGDVSEEHAAYILGVAGQAHFCCLFLTF
jgi:hypothetical protein